MTERPHSAGARAAAPTPPDGTPSRPAAPIQPDGMPLGSAASSPPRADVGPADTKRASETVARVPAGAADASRWRTVTSWLGGTRMGLVIMALVVGVFGGLAAAGFRWMVYGFTWLTTGHNQFGQQGRVSSLHLPWLGVGFFVLIPMIGGLLYGPLIDRFAREARGHGVPEVMLAVAENGGRIRPPVTLVKALASALCIGFGGSVGREGPIVQIGSAAASTLGQLVRMSEGRLRIIVACGGAAGIAATFNAPITGLFFGFEIVLREFSFDALFGTILAAFTGDVISRAFFGSAPFFTAIPHDLTIGSDWSYLAVAALGLIAGLLGIGFKTFLYGLEDRVDALWRGRPEWARPAVGGLALGALLLALPELYGVGYPVMDRAVAGHVVLGLIVALTFGKILATSLTMAIGGSGGVFAPSLFIGAMAGMAFGVGVHDAFGAAIGRPAMFAVVAMAAVFGGSAQAPLTAVASVVEMTGNWSLTLPIMLAVGIAAAVSKQISYGSIYTTKLLRRGIDIERTKPGNLLEGLTVAAAMRPLAGGRRLSGQLPGEGTAAVQASELSELIGPITDMRAPQALFEEEALEQALRQLVLYGHSGLPVLSRDGDRVLGWLGDQEVLGAIGRQLGDTAREITQSAVLAESGHADFERRVHLPTTPLQGHSLIEATVARNSPVRGRRFDEVSWPQGSVVVALGHGHELTTPQPGSVLEPGTRVVLLVPAPPSADQQRRAEATTEREAVGGGAPLAGT